MTTFHSTRSTTDSLTSKQAIRKGIADDGGLFVTDSLGETHVDIASLAGKSYQQIAFDVLSVLLPDFTETELKACISEAYGAQWSDEKITPVKPLVGVSFVDLADDFEVFAIVQSGNVSARQRAGVGHHDGGW